MKTPNEVQLASAIELLGAAQNQAEIPAAATELVAGMGLVRFVVLDIRGVDSGVRGLYHNAPAQLSAEASDLGVLSADPVLVRVRTSRFPFAWQAEANAWRVQNGDLGYRSGVAAASQGGSGSGSIVILSGMQERIAAKHEAAMLSYALLAAVMLAGAFERIARAAKPVLTQRELDCLLYALVGKSAKEAGRALGIEPRTVQQYLERARSKLGTSNSYAAAMTALRHGWLDMGQAMELAGLAAPGARNVGAAK